MSDVSLDFRKGTASKPTIWGVPWACPECHHWGYVGACAEEGRRTTDEQLMMFVGRAHRKQTGGSCLRAPERMLLGRARRRDKPTKEHPEGKLVFMLKAGEDEHTVIDVRWPLFEEQY